MKLRRHRRLAAVLLAFGLAGAQWLLGGGRAAVSACALAGCPAPEGGAGGGAAR